jgi:hypothetical protein
MATQLWSAPAVLPQSKEQRHRESLCPMPSFLSIRRLGRAQFEPKAEQKPEQFAYLWTAGNSILPIHLRLT